MATRLAALTANAMVDAVTTRMVSGSIQIRTGPQPGVNADATATGTVLATLTLDATPVGAASGGVASFNDLPLSVVAGTTGTAGHFRVLTSGGVAVYDGSCGTSGADMNLSTLSLVSGVAVTLTIANNTMPLS